MEQAYLKIEDELHWPNPIVSSATAQTTTLTGATGVKMSGPYDYVPPGYWFVDKDNPQQRIPVTMAALSASILKPVLGLRRCRCSH